MTQSGGTPTTSTSARAARNCAIAEARSEGESWRSIANRFAVSERTARRAQEEDRRAAALVEQNALDQFKGAEILARSSTPSSAPSIVWSSSPRIPTAPRRASEPAARSARPAPDLIDSLVQAGRLPDRREGYELRLRSETAKIMAAVHRLMSELGIPSERLGPAVKAQRALAERVRIDNGSRQ